MVYPFIRCLATEERQTGETYLNVVIMLEHAVATFPDEFPNIDIGTTRVHLGHGARRRVAHQGAHRAA
jgi:hypothetical protein